jgi:hypothetical protein
LKKKTVKSNENNLKINWYFNPVKSSSNIPHLEVLGYLLTSYNCKYKTGKEGIFTGDGKTPCPVVGSRNDVRLTMSSNFNFRPVSSSTCEVPYEANQYQVPTYQEAKEAEIIETKGNQQKH